MDISRMEWDLIEEMGLDIFCSEAKIKKTGKNKMKQNNCHLAIRCWTCFIFFLNC